MAGDSAVLSSVFELSDDELLEKLQEHGFSGPIVDSTRSVYQKKLIQILEGGYVASPDCGDSEEENERSDPETSVKQQIYKSSSLSNSSFQDSGTSFISSHDESVRQRVHKPSPPRPTSLSSSSVFQHSGSPYLVTGRPSLSSISGKESSYTSFSRPPHVGPQAKVDQDPSTIVSKAKLIIALVVALTLAFVFYQNLEGSQNDNPVPKIATD